MSYVKKNLVTGETLIYRTGVHWSVLFWPVVLAVLIAGAGVAAFLLRRDLLILGAVLLLVAAIVLISAIAKRNSTEIGVTNRRVIIKTGMMSRRSLEIMLPKVESIAINEPAMGRILGYGTVVIHGTGGTPEPFAKIAHPSEFRREVQQQMDLATSGRGPANLSGDIETPR
jgi:Bacterial PH domain